MDTLTTPPGAFDGIDDFPYDHGTVEVEGLDMAYVDVAGPIGSEETFLCVHGEPTWSYLYRKMIPTLSNTGRVVCPDLIGFGHSDKPAEVEDHTFELHAETTQRFIEKLELTDVTLVSQDWGGILGLLAASQMPDRFARLVPMNTGIPDGTWEMPEVWHKFKNFCAEADELPISWLIGEGCTSELPDEVVAAYEAPFPDPSYHAGPRAMPQIVPITPEMPGAAEGKRAQKVLASWDRPAFVLFSDSDPITRGARDPMRKLLPTASQEPDTWIEGAGHFLQEDAGEEVADEIVSFVERRPLG